MKTRLTVAFAMCALVASSIFAGSSTIVISEFRFRGPNGAADEFVELLNISGGAVDISGWKLNGSNNSAGTSTRATVPAGTILNAGCHYLITNSSYSGSVAGSLTYSTGITDDGGIAVIDSIGNVVDQVGLSSGSAYKEGTPLTSLGSSNVDHGYARKSGGTLDSDDNSNDFEAVSPSGPENGCPGASTAPSGSGAANPSSVNPGDATTLTVTVTPGANPDSSGIAVTADLSSIGGSASQSFSTADGVTFSFVATVATGTTGGSKALPVTITDAQSRTGAASIALTVTTPVARGTLLISQIYGGGGNSGAPLKNDFIELYNPGTTSVALSGWSVQYASATGSSWQVTPLSGSIQPGAYYLVQEAGGSVGSPLPTPDASGTISMAQGAGKVALANTTAALTGSCPALSASVDFAGFGTTANCFEGSGPTPAPSATISVIRKSSGSSLLDTDNNATDFATGTPVPRNSTLTSPPVPSNPAVVISQIYGGGGNSGATLKNDFIELFNRSDSPVSLDGWSVQYFSAFNNAWFATPLAGTIQPHGYYLVQEAFGSGGSIDLPTPDAVGTLALGAGSGKVALVQSTSPLSASCPGSLNVLDFVGYGNNSCAEGQSIGNLSNTTAAFRRVGGCTDANNNASDFFIGAPAPRNSSSATTDCSTATEPVPAPHVVINQVYAGGGNSGGVFANDFVELYNPTSGSVSLEGWSLQYASATGSNWSSQPLGGDIGPGEHFLVEFAGGSDTTQPAVPSPRIISTSIGLGASAGKVLLASQVVGFTGNCPVGNAALVDLVGYGTTADCYEGGLNAPAPSNSKALLRQGSDTDRNNTDFAAGSPNPQGSGPLIPLPPFIISTDPVGGDAPFDASITIGFSEPVGVTGTWFTIQCSSTGPHTDVEVNSAFSGDTWILTPNATFRPGETCSVHIAKDLVTDADANPLVIDGDWTFTVATGDPVENADVHLAMGNPSGASASDPDNYLLKKPEYSLSYNRSKGTPNWVSWHLTDQWTVNNSGGRTNTFRPDPAIPPAWYRVLQFDFSGTGFDRGHMCPSADRTATTPINEATFLMSNMVPQAPGNNQGPWVGLEDYLRTLTVCKLATDPCDELYIVSGPYGIGGVGDNGPMTTLANGHVTVPASTWKVALVLPKGTTPTAATRTIAVEMPNDTAIRNDDWTKYLTTVRAIEQETGYDFFSTVPEIVQNSIELGKNGANPPGVADESFTIEAGTPKDIALVALSPTGAPLTYTVTAPSHGTLSGPTANPTYTPAPHYVGTDHFTFSVNDGSRDSLTATVTLNVTDTTAPSISDLTPGAAQLWPPNHQMVDVSVAYTASDLGDASPVCTLSIASNEPIDGLGDGDMAPDWQVVDAHHVRLRAERAASGAGRIYTMTSTCSDASGNAAHESAIVTVPKSQGK